MKKNIYLNYGFTSTNEEKVRLIKKTGFDGVFLFGDDKFEENVSLCRKYSLNIETIHLPFNNLCNTIWTDDASYYMQLMKSWIDKASENNIDKVIFHLNQSTNPPKANEEGFNRIQELIIYSKNKNINLCFENLRFLEYLDEVLRRFNHLGISLCFDCGHANCFTKNIKTYDFDKYKGLIKCLHIHDNNGINDLHLLPFNGNIDYKKLVSDLKGINYNNQLSLEVIYNDKYENYTEEEYIENAYKALTKIEEYFNE